MKQQYLKQLYIKLYNFKNANKIAFCEKDVSHQNLVDLLTKQNLQDPRDRKNHPQREQNAMNDAQKLHDIIKEFLPFLREEIICLVRDSYKGDPRDLKHIERDFLLNVICWKSSASILRCVELFGDDFSERADNRNEFYKVIKEILVMKITTKNDAYIKKIDIIANKIFDLVVERLNKYKENHLNTDLNTEILEQEMLMFITKISKSFPSLKERLLNVIIPYLKHEKKSFNEIVFIGFCKLSKNFPDEMISLVESYKTHENAEIAQMASKTVKKIKRKMFDREEEEEEDEHWGYEEDYHEDFDYEDDALALTPNPLI